MNTRYEALMLLAPTVSDGDINTVSEQVSGVVTGASGAVLSVDTWGKYRLAFPVKKQEYGVYVLTRFEIPLDRISGLLNDLQSLFQIRVADQVMRYVVKRLPATGSLEYQKPTTSENPRFARGAAEMVSSPFGTEEVVERKEVTAERHEESNGVAGVSDESDVEEESSEGSEA